MPQYTEDQVLSKTQTPIETVTKEVSYVATGTVASQILSISKTASATAVKTDDPKEVRIHNTGDIPAILLLGYESYSAEAADGDVHYLQSLLLPGQTIIPPLRGIIPTAALGQVYDGTAVDFTATTNYVDSGTDLNDAGVEAGETEITVDAGGYFRVGDYIQLGTTAATTATQIEILEVTGISTHALTVKRGLFGTVDGDKDAQITGHDDNSDVYFPFFNELMGVYDTAGQGPSGRGNPFLIPNPITNGSGAFKARNLYGYGRTDSTTTFGITPGSVMLQFYEPGYQEITADGDLTANDSTGLTANTTYYMSIAIDGKTTDAITFATGSSVKFGGSDGVIAAMQTAIDNLKPDPAKNAYKIGATVAIVNGNLRITSNQLSSSSAIAITTNTDGTSGTDELFDGTNTFGRFPADLPEAVAAKVPDSPRYDSITNKVIPNLDRIIYDDGAGNLMSGGEKKGVISYESGALNFTCDYKYAQFKISCLHSGPFSGKRDADEAARANSLTAVHATVQNTRMVGKIKIEVF